MTAVAETLEREHELDRIAAALDAAADGAGRTVVIEGPAGIGKTRLVQVEGRPLMRVEVVWRRMGSTHTPPFKEPTMTTTQTTPTQTGITVSTAITAGGIQLNHGEGIVVSTPLTAGGWVIQHAEGIVVSTAITGGGFTLNHAEAVVAR